MLATPAIPPPMVCPPGWAPMPPLPTVPWGAWRGVVSMFWIIEVAGLVFCGLGGTKVEPGV